VGAEIFNTAPGQAGGNKTLEHSGPVTISELPPPFSAVQGKSAEQGGSAESPTETMTKNRARSKCFLRKARGIFREGFFQGEKVSRRGTLRFRSVSLSMMCTRLAMRLDSYRDGGTLVSLSGKQGKQETAQLPYSKWFV
jgi:hypothetical protein